MFLWCFFLNRVGNIVAAIEGGSHLQQLVHFQYAVCRVQAVHPGEAAQEGKIYYFIYFELSISIVIYNLLSFSIDSLPRQRPQVAGRPH